METARSIGRVTCASISSGATLGQEVTTEMLGSDTSGRRSTGRRVRQMAPRRTIAAMRIVTVTGRETENFAMFIPAAALRSQGPRQAPGLDQCQTGAGRPVLHWGARLRLAFAPHPRGARPGRL